MANFPADFNDYMFYTDIDWRAGDDREARLWGEWFLNGQPISTSADSTIVNVKDFGAVGDGVANDLIPIQNAISAGAGKTVYFPVGTYLAILNAPGTFFNVSAGTTLLGGGSSTIQLKSNSTDYSTGMVINGDDVTFDGLKFRRASSYITNMFVLADGVDRLTFKNCSIDGANDVFAEQGTQIIRFPESGTVTDLFVENCTFRNFMYVMLQTNGSTATVSNIKVINCDFENWVGDALGFNAPSGMNRNILIDGCSFKTTIGMFGVSLAHVENVRIINNYFEVTANEGVHIEDYTCYVVVANNTFHECAVTGGFGAVEIIDSHHITVDANTFRNSTVMSNTTVVHSFGVDSGLTGSGQPALGATYSITISNNIISAGPNTGIVIFNMPQLAVTGNTITGGLSINSSFVESGTNDKIGIQHAVSQQFGAKVADNIIKGFRFGISSSLSLESNAFQPGTVISGNNISECRYGIMGNNCMSVAITGNHINRCWWPLVMGPSGFGAYGAGMFPYSIVGNVFYGNKFPGSFGGKLVVVSKNAATIGSVTLTTEPVPIEWHTSYIVTFTGGGTFTPSAYTPAGSTSVAGTLATANIAANEVGYKTGIIDRPNGAPYTETNRSVGLNADSVAGTYT